MSTTSTAHRTAQSNTEFADLILRMKRMTRLQKQAARLARDTDPEITADRDNRLLKLITLNQIRAEIALLRPKLKADIKVYLQRHTPQPEAKPAPAATRHTGPPRIVPARRTPARSRRTRQGTGKITRSPDDPDPDSPASPRTGATA